MPVSIVEQVVTEQQNSLTTFVSLLVKEEKAQTEAKEKAKDTDESGEKKDEKKNRDPIVTDTSCKP